MIAEIALSLTLVTGAATLIRSFLKVRPDNPGFQTRDRLVLSLSLSPAQYRIPRQQADFVRRVVENLATIPGVTAVTSTSTLPLSGSIGIVDVATAGNSAAASRFEAVTDSYFRTMEIHLQRGRVFTADDRDGAPPVAVVNEAFARRFFGNADAVGRTVHFKLGQRACDCTVVGVVDTVKMHVEPETQRPVIYVPYDQLPTALVRFVIATTVSLEGMIPKFRQIVRDLDPNQPILNLRTLRETIDNEVLRSGTRWQLMTAAAVVAMLVATAGIYSVIVYNVSQRTREIGIRLAFGARPKDVVGSIVARSGRSIAIGLLLGTFAAWAAVRLLVKNMSQVFPVGPEVYLLTAIALAATGLLACLLPARRALRVDPVVALRGE
jgi:predicted permease